MKSLPYIIIIILVLFIVFRPTRVERVPGEVVRDTIITNRIDTVWGTVPIPVYESVVDSFPFVVPVPVPGRYSPGYSVFAYYAENLQR